MSKNTFLLIGFIIFSTLVHSQETFLKIYPSPEHQELTCVIETNNNQLILCGIRTFDARQTYLGTLIKMDMNGEIIQSITDDFQSGNSFYTGLKKSMGNDGVYYLYGSRDSIVGSETYNTVFVNTLDNNLEVVTSRDFGKWVLGKNIPQDIEIVNDSIAFILSFWVPNDVQTQFNLSLIRANLLNNSYHYYIPEDGYYRVPSAMIFDQINDRLKINYNGWSPNPTYRNPIINISTDLTTVNFIAPVNDFKSQTRIEIKGDTSYFLSGSKFHPYNPDYRELGIAEYNMRDSLLKQVFFPGRVDSMTYPGAGETMVVTTDNIWVVGWYNVIPQFMPCTPEPTWVILNRLNHNLELQEQFYYGGDGAYVPRYIIETSDHFLVVTGEYYNPDLIPYECQFDPFVLKVNSEGLIVNTTNPDVPSAQEALVFPNPGSGYLQVKLAIQHPQARLQLFDINGRSILEEEISTDMQQVNTSSLPTGIYPYRITANGRVIGNGKWVKE